jgi:N utilization substance protein B
MGRKGFYESRSRARRRALQAIYQWQMTGQEARDILTQFNDIQDMRGVDAEHFEKLLHGVSATADELDTALQPFLDRDARLLEPMERAVLRIGAFELLNCPEQPYRVVVRECVDLADRFGSAQGHAYVNAVLDRAARQWRADEIAHADSR